MKAPTRAPGYTLIYHGLAEVARRYGYALAIHGSVLTDLDLVAVPWTEEAAMPAQLVTAIAEHCGHCLVNIDHQGIEHQEPEQKPHGRLAWKLHMDAGGAVDLSVIPPRASGAATF